MGHFTSEEWADFVRGIQSADRTIAIQQHLERKCERCRKDLATWSFVADLGSKEASYEPPADVVRYVKTCHVVGKPPGKRRGWMNVARLVFDTIRQPQPAGIRSSGLSPRQLLFKSGNLLVDLRVESQAKSNHFSVAGQVLDWAKPGQAVEQVPIVLSNKKNMVMQTASNQFGEFQLEFEMAENLLLTVGKDDPIVVPLGILDRNANPGEDVSSDRHF
ncbi:MAG TPA: hypothetical protein VGL91_21185 [Acidobacteriota bacterium]|jgi:hypothetical protein